MFPPRLTASVNVTKSFRETPLAASVIVNVADPSTAANVAVPVVVSRIGVISVGVSPWSAYSFKFVPAPV